MKNVIVYIKLENTPYKYHNTVLDYLKAQIDNCIVFNWNKNDIIVVSNFDFEYNGIKNVYPSHICDFNVWGNKFYSVRDLLKNHFTDDVWLHDYDVWQIDNFEFPQFDGMFAGCPYDKLHQNWNGGSYFFTKNSLPLLDYIYDYHEINKKKIIDLDPNRGLQWLTDEIIVCDLRRINDIKNLFSSLTPQYNLGMTLFNSRYDYAKKPIKMIHVKLLDRNSLEKYESMSVDLNLIPNHLYGIINKYTR